MRPLDGTVVEVATAQHGVVTRAQLLAVGMSSAAIKRRVRAGLLLAQHPGVYRVGHRAPSLEATYMAAVLASGDGALMCGRAAGRLLRILKGSPPPPEVIARTNRRIEGIATRRCRTLDRVDATTVRGIPTTSVAWTLVDLAAALSLDDLARACHEAGGLHHTTPAQVAAALARRPNSRGAGALKRVLHGDAHVTLSALERRFLRLLRENGLELPRTNRVAGGRRVDCRWPHRRLTVELDSYRFHQSRHAWERDRHREREARARGDEFRRYTYGDVFEHPHLMLRELRDLLH
jgi:Transcriptional regulator, AbiEi antitoxin